MSYEKFFKEAGKASGLVTGKPAPKQKEKFKLSESRKATGDRVAIGTPEDQLRREMSRRQKERKAVATRKRQAFPIFPAIIAVVAIISCAIGYFQPDAFDPIVNKITHHVDIGFGTAQAAETKAEAKSPAKPAAAAAAAPVVPEAKSVAEAVASARGEAPSDIRSWSDEELGFFNKLNDRKKELDLREAELSKLEEELQKQKAELDDKIKQLETMRADISKTLKTRVAVDQEKVDKLVQTYSTMKAQNAAKIIETLNEDLAVEVIDKMKKKSAAEIMNMMDAKKARRISELLTGYQRAPATAETASSQEAAPSTEAAE